MTLIKSKKKTKKKAYKSDHKVHSLRQKQIGTYLKLFNKYYHCF